MAVEPADHPVVAVRIRHFIDAVAGDVVDSHQREAGQFPVAVAEMECRGGVAETGAFSGHLVEITGDDDLESGRLLPVGGTVDAVSSMDVANSPPAQLIVTFTRGAGAFVDFRVVDGVSLAESGILEFGHAEVRSEQIPPAPDRRPPRAVNREHHIVVVVARIIDRRGGDLLHVVDAAALFCGDPRLIQRRQQH